MKLSEISIVTAAKRDALLQQIAFLKIDPNDIDESFVKGSGKGGQKKNKTSNAVQLVYRPRNMRVSAQRERERSVNRFLALRQLVEGLMKEFEKIKRDWAQRGFGCDIWTDPPGKVWRDYVHETDELVMLQEGEVEFVFGGQNHRPQVGEKLLIPAGTKHTVTNCGKTRNRWLYGYKSR